MASTEQPVGPGRVQNDRFCYRLTQAISNTMEHDHRQRGEPELSEICPGCGAPDRFSCTCVLSLRPAPLGQQPYTIAISPEELEIAVHHRAATGEPLQTFVRRLIRESDEARSLRALMTSGVVDLPIVSRRAERCARRWGDHPRRGPPLEPEPDGAR